MIRDLSQEVEGIAACNSGEHHEDAEEVFGEWLQDSRIAHGNDAGLGDLANQFGVGKLGAGDFSDHLSRHLDRIEEVQDPDRDKTDRNATQIFESVEESVLQSNFPGARDSIDGERESIQHGKHSKNWKEEDGGEFGQLSEAEEDTGPEDVFVTWILQKTDKEVEGEENEGGNADVGRDIVTVTDDVRIEEVEEGCEEASNCPSEFLRPAEDEETEEERDEDEGETRPESD